MSSTKLVNPKLLQEIKKYGAFDISSCFNCGTCTAICPLSENDANFPRRIIRYAQLGQEERLLGSKELWLCYYCGECSDTCPREAEPGEFMMSARRYAIANYDFTGVSKLFYKSKVAAFGILAFVALITSLFFFLLKSDPIDIEQYYFFQYINPEYIDWAGIALFAFILVAFIIGVTSMVLKISKQEKQSLEREKIEIKETLPRKLYRTTKNLIVVLFMEVLLQKRYFRKEKVKEEHFLTSKWFLHLSIVIGFIGLLLATALNFLFLLIKIRPTGTPMPITSPFIPVRILGTLSGLLLVYGTSVAMYRRIMKKDTFRKHSDLSDWLFLILLWGAGITGFILEILVYLKDFQVLEVTAFYFWMFIIHVIFAAELLVLVPFSKFAHAIYRTIALWIYENFHNAPKTYPEEAGIIMMEDDVEEVAAT
ncbi:MAG: 4Fe-4S dicluster domain-containing protein [Candidatus Heimdallarchaeaceae archaeon]